MRRPPSIVIAGLAGLLVVAGGAYLVARDDAEVAALSGTTTTTESTTTSTVPDAPDAPDVSAAPTTTTTASPSPAPSPSPSLTPVVPPSTVPLPAFQSSIEPVTAEQLGSSWRPGCPHPVEQLRAVNVTHVGYDGTVHSGRLIVDTALAERVATVFRDLYAARFPIQRIEPVDRYGSDDQASMRANNTSGFNCRTVAGSSSWSEHAYGRAIDVNPLVNPYVRGSSVDPPEGAPFADRSRSDPGMIHADDAAVRAFAAQGWEWGGYWSGGKDYQHFSASGR